MIRNIRNIFEQVSDVVYACDLKGTLIFVNRYTCNFLGVSAGEILNKHFTEFISDDQKNVLKAQLRSKSLDDLNGFYNEIKLKKKSDNDLWIGQRMHIIRDDQGSPSYLLMIGHLISKLKSQELSLRETELKLKTIINSALDAVVVIDQEGQITEWNTQAESIFGWKKSEVLGKRISETIIPDQHVEAHEKGMNNYMKTGHGPVLNKRIEIIGKKSDGSIFPIELAIIPNKIGGKHFFSAFVRDITKKNEQEQALKESEQRWQKLVNNQPEAIQITKNAVVEYLNPAGYELYGASEPEEIIGKNLLEVTSPSKKSKFNERLSKLSKGETLTPLEFDITTLKGDRKTIEVRSTPIVFKGEKMIQTIARDITEKKKNERRREELLSQLKKANDNLSEFAHVISHDLKAPLRAISSLSEWLIEDYEDKLDKDGRESLQLLIQNVSRMDQLIDGVLSYSMATQSQGLEEQIQTKNQIQSVIRLLNIPKNITIALKGDFPLIVFNKFQFRQIVQNLLSNSIKFIGAEDGRIEIKSEYLKEKHSWLFSFKDNGPGISENKEEVFQLFSSYSDKKTDSTGIGLSIVKKILNDHGERIWFENNKENGVTFYFTLKEHYDTYERAEIDFTT